MHYELAKQIFSNGDDVVILDTEQELDWGRITLDPKGILLTSIVGRRAEGVGEYFYPYSELSLVSQDGFKFKRLDEGIVERTPSVKVHKLTPTTRGITAMNFLLGEDCDTVANKLANHGPGAVVERAIKDHERYVTAVKSWFTDPRGKDGISHGTYCFGDPILVENITHTQPSRGNLILTQQGGARAILSRNADLYLSKF